MTDENQKEDPFAGFNSRSTTFSTDRDAPAAEEDGIKATENQDPEKFGAEKAPSAAQEDDDPLAAFRDKEEASDDSDEEPADDAEAPEEDADEDEDLSEEPEASGEKKKSPAQKRIDELTRLRRQAERTAEEERRQRQALEERIARLEKPSQEPSAEKQQDAPDEEDSPKPPDPADYTYGEVDSQYLSDMVSFNVSQKLQEEKQKEAEKRQAEAATRQQRELSEKWDALGETGKTTYDDFEDVVIGGANAGRYQLSPTLAQAIPESEFGADILYHLASNPKESARVAEMSPVRQVAYLGRLEAALEQSAKRKKGSSTKVSKAPPPPKKRQPRGAGGKFAASFDPATTDFREFEQGFRELQEKRGK